MDIKTAWAIRPGDVIEMAGGFGEVVGKVQKMLWSGEFEGRQYQQAPMVKFELASVPGVWHLTPGDKVYPVITRERKRESY